MRWTHTDREREREREKERERGREIHFPCRISSRVNHVGSGIRTRVFPLASRFTHQSTKLVISIGRVQTCESMTGCALSVTVFMRPTMQENSDNTKVDCIT
ncbi:hypothetical protein FHG87_010316 [Trinorchestia longiramus]|nr:hypothetical protein FHG87_010316 [Trinorchestia longiramus]